MTRYVIFYKKINLEKERSRAYFLKLSKGTRQQGVMQICIYPHCFLGYYFCDTCARVIKGMELRNAQLYQIKQGVWKMKSDEYFLKKKLLPIAGKNKRSTLKGCRCLLKQAGLVKPAYEVEYICTYSHKPTVFRFYSPFSKYIAELLHQLSMEINSRREVDVKLGARCLAKLTNKNAQNISRGDAKLFFKTRLYPKMPCLQGNTYYPQNLAQRLEAYKAGKIQNQLNKIKSHIKQQKND